MINLQSRATRPTRRSQLGVTMLELMIVVGIVGLLAAIAFPSFMQNVRDSRRTDAHVALTRTSQNLERFFGSNGTYTVNTAQLGFAGGDALSDSGDYVITVAAGPSGIGSSYVVTATAAAGSMQVDDAGCTVMTLDSRGRRTPDPNDSDCW